MASNTKESDSTLTESNADVGGQHTDKPENKCLNSDSQDCNSHLPLPAGESSTLVTSASSDNIDTVGKTETNNKLAVKDIVKNVVTESIAKVSKDVDHLNIAKDKLCGMINAQDYELWDMKNMAKWLRLCKYKCYCKKDFVGPHVSKRCTAENQVKLYYEALLDCRHLGDDFYTVMECNIGANDRVDEILVEEFDRVDEIVVESFDRVSVKTESSGSSEGPGERFVLDVEVQTDRLQINDIAVLVADNRFDILQDEAPIIDEVEVVGAAAVVDNVLPKRKGSLLKSLNKGLVSSSPFGLVMPCLNAGIKIGELLNKASSKKLKNEYIPEEDTINYHPRGLKKLVTKRSKFDFNKPINHTTGQLYGKKDQHAAGVEVVSDDLIIPQLYMHLRRHEFESYKSRSEKLAHMTKLAVKLDLKLDNVKDVNRYYLTIQKVVDSKDTKFLLQEVNEDHSRSRLRQLVAKFSNLPF